MLNARLKIKLLKILRDNLIFTLISVFIILSSSISYLLFHGLIEIFSITIASSIFIITWNLRNRIDNNFFVFLGISFLFVAIIDTFHTFAYEGMRTFSSYSPDLPTQLWVSARLMNSALFLAAPIFVSRKIKPFLTMFIYFVITGFLFASIFYWGLFPLCFIPGQGLTIFKITCELVISFILLTSLYSLYKKRKYFDNQILLFLYLSIVLLIFSEVSFTLYSNSFDIKNMLGHYLKLLSFYFLYKAVIKSSLLRPFRSLFRQIKLNEIKLKKSRALMQKAQKISKMGFCEYDLKNGTAVWSDEFYTIFKRPKKAGPLTGDWKKYIHPDDIERVSMIAEKSMVQNSNYSLDYRIIRSDNRIRHVHSEIEVIRDDKGNPVYFIATALDVTKSKENETEKESLLREIQTKTSELQEIIHVTSHDLRSPLLNIKGYSEELRNDSRGLIDVISGIDLPDKYKNRADELIQYNEESISSISSSLTQVDQLINGLNKVAQVRNHTLEAEDLDMDNLLRDVIKSNKFEIEQNNIKVDLEDLPPCWGEERQISQVFSNLISNAIKYRHPRRQGVIRIAGRKVYQGTPCCIKNKNGDCPVYEKYRNSKFKENLCCVNGNKEGCSVYQKLQENNMQGTLYTVEDNGLGIPEELHERIFDLFYRGQETEKPGEGLGLSIVKKIISRHNGEIWLKSRVDQGSKFCILFPRHL